MFTRFNKTFSEGSRFFMRYRHIHVLLLGMLTCAHALAQENAAPSALPNSLDLCVVQHPAFDTTQLSQGREIIVRSDNAQMIEDTTAQFDGNVTITSSQAIITADTANIAQSGRKVVASGDVEYIDETLRVLSQGVELNNSLKLLQMEESDYEIKELSGRGTAQLLSISGERGLLLESVTFTTCPRGGEDWQIKASEISISKDNPFGRAYNTRFYVGGVPVFYLPYFAFPVTAERQTGLLFPKIGSSQSVGIEYEQPFYWNIAPNYDATISPRWMTERGLQLKTEFRYLNQGSRGELQLEYLPSDLDLEDNSERYFYRYTHQGAIGNDWNLNVDFSGLSDDNYIVDLGSDYYNRADTHLQRQVGLSYYSEKLDFNLQFRDFDIIGDHPDVYRALPEMKLDYHSDISQYFEFSVNSELAYFQNSSDALPDAVRLHIEPSIRVPYQRAWGELLAEVSLLNTYYAQDVDENSALADETLRTLGQARLYGSLIFEKPQTLFNNNYTLTVEPKAQYLFTSYENQTDIGLYDTTFLLTNFGNLFRGQDFTGLDRINENNKVTLGMTSRLIDSANREQMVFSFGQIFYLANAKLLDGTRDGNRSALAAELDWQVNQRWFLHSDIQIETQTDRVQRSSFATEYRIQENKLIQLNHRYIRDLSGEKIDQVGISASWPMGKNWHWVARWYRDTERSRTTESFFGLQYESCCWALRMTAQRHLSNRFDDAGIRTQNDFDSGIALQFVFKGIGSPKDATSMLEQGMFGYRQPYVLNE